MEASSVTRRPLRYAVVRDWAWWQLPSVLRSYVGAVPVAAFVMIAYAASQTTWTASDLLKFLLLLVCGMVSVVATPRVAYLKAGVARDFLTAWVLPVAIVLPPVYAMLTPIPLQVLTQWRVHKGVVYRRVFTAGAISLTYGAASLLFRQFPRFLRRRHDRLGDARHHLGPGRRRMRAGGRLRPQVPDHGRDQAERPGGATGRAWR